MTKIKPTVKVVKKKIIAKGQQSDKDKGHYYILNKIVICSHFRLSLCLDGCIIEI